MYTVKHLMTVIALLLLAGCSRPPVEATVSIEGMSCPNCATGITTTLRSCEGVEMASISYANESGTITASDEEAIKLAIERVMKNPQYVVEYTLVEEQPGS